MRKISRADFLRGSVAVVGGAALGTAIIPSPAAASHPKGDYGKFYGILFDATKCIGCRTCEKACNIVNNRPQPDEVRVPEADFGETDEVYDKLRRTGYSSHTVINRFRKGEEGNPFYVKYQCMHCNEPACVSACIVGALTKDGDGPVHYEQGDCIGCRYCVVACPFQVPVYEFHDPITPAVLKCTLCEPRIKRGELPACVKACPMEAMTFGRREKLVELAHKLIEKHPDRYHDEIWGEHVVGGTGWMYLLPKEAGSFDKLHKLPFDESMQPLPPVTEEIQHAIFKYFIPPIVFYGVLAGIHFYNEGKLKHGVPGAHGGGDAGE